jgi:asparagine N-glycosylation enzyme membrane subunit Stt3
MADWRTFSAYLKIAAAVGLIAATLVASSLTARNVGSLGRIMAVTPEWEEALTWMAAEENTQKDSKIMCWWDYGYWILDLSHRVPVVDNGVHWASTDREIARAYCATDDMEAVEIMQKLGARYFIFSDIEVRILPVLSWEALGAAYGDRFSVPPELKDSLFARALGGQLEFNGGLRRVYPTDDVTDPSVVILALQ